LYFCIACVLWDIVAFGETGVVGEVDAQKLGVVLAGLSLPAGYLLSVTTQWLYYDLLPHSQVHSRIWKKRTGIKLCESCAEAEMTVCIRGGIEAAGVERAQWVQQFNSRRWDVFAMNRTVLFASVAAPLIVICAEWSDGGNYLDWSKKHTVIVVVTTLVIGIALRANYIMKCQIERVMDGCYTYLILQRETALRGSTEKVSTTPLR